MMMRDWRCRTERESISATSEFVQHNEQNSESGTARKTKSERTSSALRVCATARSSSSQATRRASRRIACVCRNPHGTRASDARRELFRRPQGDFARALARREGSISQRDNRSIALLKTFAAASRAIAGIASHSCESVQVIRFSIRLRSSSKDRDGASSHPSRAAATTADDHSPSFSFSRSLTACGLALPPRRLHHLADEPADQRGLRLRLRRPCRDWRR